MPAPTRPGDIVPPLLNAEMAPQAGQTYLTWQKDDYTHISPDRANTLCGAFSASSQKPLVTMDPLGKPRCRKCLELAGMKALENEPSPVRDKLPAEVKRPATEPQTTAPVAVPGLKMPPPDFFSSVRQK